MTRSRLQQAKTARRITAAIVRFVFLAAFSYILVYPLVYMVSTAFKSVPDYSDPTVVWVPKYPNFENFVKAMAVTDYAANLWNTVRFSVVSAVLEVFSCSVYAYGLSRYKMRGKSIMLGLLVVTILVPDIMMIVPRMLTFKQLDLFGILGLIGRLTGTELRPNIIDTPLAFYLPSLFGVGLKGGLLMFIYMQFYKNLPGELEEASWLDGAGPFQTYFRIVLPSSGVVTLTVFILSVLWHWNDYLQSLMYTNTNRTLAVVMTDIDQYMYLKLQLDSTSMVNYGVPLAACILFILPPLVMYMFLQRQFIQSIDRVGIVG